MSLLATLVFSNNGRQSVKLNNHRTGQANKFTYIAYGNFGSGSVAVELSPDAGTTWVANIDAGSGVSFSAADSRAVEVNSDGQEPVELGFNLSGATSPDLTIKVYDNR